jgi:hypothetical protein
MNPLTKQVALGVFIGGLALLLLVAGGVTGYERLQEYQRDQEEIQMKSLAFRTDAPVVYKLIADHDKKPSQFPEVQEDYLENRLNLLSEAAQTDLEKQIIAALRYYRHWVVMQRLGDDAESRDKLREARADAQAVMESFRRDEPFEFHHAMLRIYDDLARYEKEALTIHWKSTWRRDGLLDELKQLRSHAKTPREENFETVLSNYLNAIERWRFGKGADGKPVDPAALPQARGEAFAAMASYATK